RPPPPSEVQPTTVVGRAEGVARSDGKAERVKEPLLGPLTDFLYERYWRVTLQGAENLPAGGCLLVANHKGARPIDRPILRLALGRHRPELPPARWLAEENVLRVPILGALLSRMGASAATPETALQLLAEGRKVIVFPEGVQGINKCFRDRYQLKPFGRG